MKYAAYIAVQVLFVANMAIFAMWDVVALYVSKQADSTLSRAAWRWNLDSAFLPALLVLALWIHAFVAEWWNK